jgi:hypothetical protein
MNIHEYQAKTVLRDFGLPVSRGIAATTVEEAVKAAEALGGSLAVVKSQIHAGAARDASRSSATRQRAACGSHGPSKRCALTPGRCSATPS